MNSCSLAIPCSLLWVWRLEARKAGENIIDANKSSQVRPGKKIISNRLILRTPGFCLYTSVL